jgi:hypothetical protein
MSNIKKLAAKRRRHAFKRRRGNYRPLSEQLMNGGEKIDHSLRQYWSQRVHTPRGFNLSKVPEDMQGLFQRNRAAQGQLNPANPARTIWLENFYPGVQMTSEERGKAKALMDKLMAEHPPEQSVSLLNSKNVKVYLCWQGSVYWIVKREYALLRKSLTFGSSQRAKEAYKLGYIRWQITERFELKE